MALESNAYTRTSATADGVVPNLYDEQAEKYLYEAEALRPLCVDKSGMIKNKAGKSFQMFKETAFSVSSLTEGVDTPVSALDFNNVTLTVGWYGDAKQISLETLTEDFDFVWGDLQYGASNALAVNRDNKIMTELLNTTSSAIYPINTGVTRYTSSDIVATATLSYEQIVKLKTTMRLNHRKLKYVIVHPNQEYNLLQDEKFINADYKGDSSIKTGVLGMMSGALFISHTAVQSVTENSVTVYQAIGLAERSVIYAQKVDPVFEFDREYNRKRGITFHYYEAFGSKILHNEGVVPVKSA